MGSSKIKVMKIMVHPMGFYDKNLGVFCCSHVFRHERPVNLVVYEEGDWQFMCGMNDHQGASDGFYVHVGHLIDRDTTLNEVADLSDNWEAERREPGAPWIKSIIDQA